jgi:hypothetical protein
MLIRAHIVPQKGIFLVCKYKAIWMKPAGEFPCLGGLLSSSCILADYIENGEKKKEETL